jgi:uncharacterized protein (DUF58 family)
MSERLTRVFSPAFLHQLDQLRLVLRRSLGTRPGSTPMPTGSQETGMEMSRYASYAPGDELRHLDWNVYGRLDQLLVKRFRAEREAPLHVLIDTSASMASPAEDGKLAFALAVAAALSYISLRRHDPVRFITLGTRERLFRVSPWFGHSRRLPQIRTCLAGHRAEGSGSMAEGIRAYLESSRTPGLAVLLSDFLVPPFAYETALDLLRARGFEVAAVRVLGPRERDPGTLRGRVRLHDVESGQDRVVRLTGDHRDAYARALAAHLTRLREWCVARRIVFALGDTARSVDSFLLHDLTVAGLLR